VKLVDTLTAMAELKTKKTEASIDKFLDSIEDRNKREDAYTLLNLLKKCSEYDGKMWGQSIIGFGQERLVYESGRELDWFLIGFSPRKQNIVVYFVGSSFDKSFYLKKLGKHKTGKGCLYINKLEDIDLRVFEEMVRESLKKRL
jgi:hypothetical protein